MPLYSIEINIVATAYIKADTVQQAMKIAKDMKNCTPALDSDGGDFPISGRDFSDPDLPEVSISPAMTIHGPCKGQVPSLADDN